VPEFMCKLDEGAVVDNPILFEVSYNIEFVIVSESDNFGI